MNGPSDRDLWARASGEDPEAFGLLFDRHSRAVYNFCFRRTADWSLAEDLTSAVFLEAWRRRRDVALESESALPWLLGVANNLLRNTRRALRRYRDALSRIPPPLVEAGDPGDEVAARLDEERRMRRTLTALAELPVEEQEVLSLCVWTGLSYEEAAEALEIPIGTVRSRLHRARSKLRELEAASEHNMNERGTFSSDAPGESVRKDRG